MILRNVLNLMLSEADRPIKLKEYRPDGNGRVYYDGSVQKLSEYMETHDNLNTADGFPYQVQSLWKWNVVEILVDNSRDEDLPVWNKGKILVII